MSNNERLVVIIEKEWPKRVNDWRGMVWACCESSGPACNHMRLPDGTELDRNGYPVR